MGLAARVIPTLLIRGDQLVKGKRFDAWRSVGHPEQAVKVHAQRGVDELILLDIGATPEGRRPNLKLIEKLTRHCFTPITVGGGVRSVEDVRDLLNAGADKVAIKTHVGTIGPAADKFGSQAIVAALDITWPRTSPIIAGTAAVMAAGLRGLGAGEILLTSVPREGTMEGYDLDLIREVSAAVDCPVVAHGGCSGYADMADAIACGASGVAAGALFAFTDATPRGAAEYLAKVGVEVRV